MARHQHTEALVVRKGLDFDLESEDIPRYWMAGNPFKTRLMDAIQATFPDGERYFIASVKAFRDRITQPALQAAVRDFSHQEGQHGLLHTRYNDRLRRQGIHVDAFTQHTRAMCDGRLKKYSAEYNVALTAALEHFTAMMADLFFAEKSSLEGADPRVRALFAWHAIEEMEHKAVAYDVMQQVAGVGYFMRATAMTHATASFTLFTLVAPWFILKMDGFSTAERVQAYRENLAWLAGPRKGLLGRLLPKLAQYYRPGFHPNDLPSVHTYPAWVQAFAQSGDPIEAAEAMYRAAA